QPGKPLPRPADIDERRVTFAAGLEQPRTDYFIKGTGMSQIAVAPAESRRPRIVNPVAGSVYALDPDIPPERQRMAIAVNGDVTGHRLLLDKRDLGAADSRPLILAPPGRHSLKLVDLSGRVVDQVMFTVR
ncbi:MAG: penicillin-binding protein 1C, partial [Sphingomonas sp.]